MKNLIKQILKEETEELDKRVLNFLRRHVKIDEINIGDDEWKMTVKKASFNVGDDWYLINSYMSKKEMTNYIIRMLDDNGIIDSEGYQINVKDLDRQKMVKTVRHFIDIVFNKK